MTANVISVRPDTPVVEIARLLAEGAISGVPVIGENGAIAGIVSEGDLVHELTSVQGPKHSWWLELIGGRGRAAAQVPGKCAEDVMSRGVICAYYFAPIPTIAALLEKHQIKRVPVTHHAKVVGIVTRANLVQFLAFQKPYANSELAEKDQQIRAQLMADILASGCSKLTLLNVAVDNGVVTYWGFVDCEDTTETLRALAENMNGVNAVEANMGISTMLEL